MISWGIGDFFLQRMSRKVGNIEALIFINFAGTILLLPFVFNHFLSLTWDTFLPLLVLSFVDTAFGLIALKAYGQGKLCVIDVILIMELPLTIFLGMIFLGEKLNALQTVLIFMIMTGIIFIAKERVGFIRRILSYFYKGGLALEKGVMVAMLAALLSAVHNFLIAFNAREVSPFMTIWLPWTLSNVWILIYLFYKYGTKKIISGLISHFKKNKKIIIYGSLFDNMAWLCYAGALAGKELSITTAITESYPVLAMFLGVKFNKEKISGWQYAGAALALGGSFVIAMIS